MPLNVLYATSADGDKVTDGTPTEWITGMPTITNGDTLGIRPDLVGRPITSWADLLSAGIQGQGRAAGSTRRSARSTWRWRWRRAATSSTATKAT